MIYKACFTRRATAVPAQLIKLNSAVGRLGFKRHATAVPNSSHKF